MDTHDDDDAASPQRLATIAGYWQLDAAKVRHAIRVRGWSLAKLGEEAGLSGPTITRAVRGDTITRASALRISTALDKAPVIEHLAALLPDPRGEGEGSITPRFLPGSHKVG